ncbi:MAG: metallophosphoesterase [Olegusella sp.]|nr:metallophosphoesterase [Olegusella sp.]
MIWFTADTHFGHANAIEFGTRPFRDVDEMDRRLVAAINDRVSATDELWVLGDYSWRIGVDDAYAIRRKINCRHVHLILGNHDRDWSTGPYPDAFETVEAYRVLKARARAGGSGAESRSGKLVLFHYPICDWDGRVHGSIHLHGHIHSRGSDYNEWMRDQGILAYDVGVDANGWAPVSLDHILDWFDGVEPSMGVALIAPERLREMDGA